MILGNEGNPKFPLLPGPLSSRKIVPIGIPSLGQSKLFNHLLSIIVIDLKSYICVQIIYIR